MQTRAENQPTPQYLDDTRPTSPVVKPLLRTTPEAIDGVSFRRSPANG